VAFRHGGGGGVARLALAKSAQNRRIATAGFRHGNCDPSGLTQNFTRRSLMGKTLGLAVALTLGLALTAAAQDARGTIRSMNTHDHTIVLEDGTRLWVTEGQEAAVSPGSYIEAAYESKGDKKVVTEMHPRVGLDGSTDPLKSLQSGD
jgi:hypothetical protein